MNDDIKMAQVKAGENAVVERLRQKGLLSSEDETWTPKYPDVKDIFKAMERRHERQRLESTLATTFIAQQREGNPAERTRLWNECLRLVDEIEKLNE